MLKATVSDKNQIVTILCDAFEGITIPNSINFVIKQDQYRKKRLKVLMEYLVDTTFLFGDIYLSASKNTCLLIQYPHLKKTTFKTILFDLRLAFKCIGIFRIFKVLKREIVLNKCHIKEPHIHPIIMATKNNNKGKGSGYRLIKQVLEKYQSNKLPIIIETTTLENIKLYEHFGFSIFKKTNQFDYPLYFLRK
ncbi:GNAT family N-acetyltransferase [Tenacibaculum sp. 190524A02b]|uniref:GNAT family N-acetyltransferase n=1 Tax=Tenacibaculum vairaonense TaxID=3137860 RepID=UPI0031FB20F8